MSLTMSVTWTDGTPSLEVEKGTLTTAAQVLAMADELKKLAKLMPTRAARPKKSKAKSSRQTASPRPRKSKSVNADVAEGVSNV